MSAGRISLVIPPRATQGMPTITITVPDSTVLKFNLGISPASANGFSPPAALTVQCDGLLGPVSLQSASVSCYDPTKGQWLPVAGSTVDLSSLSISAPLAHFSNYRVNATPGP